MARYATAPCASLAAPRAVVPGRTIGSATPWSGRNSRISERRVGRRRKDACSAPARRLLSLPASPPTRKGKHMRAKTLIALAIAIIAAAFFLRGGVDTPVPTSNAAATAANPLDDIIQRRGLTPDEAEAALETFVPPGKYDDFVMVTSGGHRGTVMLYG